MKTSYSTSLKLLVKLPTGLAQWWNAFIRKEMGSDLGWCRLFSVYLHHSSSFFRRIPSDL